MALRLTTAGESHGPGLTCIIEGLPAGLELDRDAINRDLARRQLGHGRGGRMKIERDRADVTGGVRHGRTLGGPIALQILNRDYANWEERMNPWPVEGELAEVHLPRPGHADLRLSSSTTSRSASSSMICASTESSLTPLSHSSGSTGCLPRGWVPG